MVVAIVIIAIIAVAQSPQPAATSSDSGLQMMTIDPRVVANLTALPKATPLAGQDANQLNGLLQLVDACSEYAPARHDQMVEQISFIVDPAQLSGDVILALGTNPRGKLLFAISQVTKIQWQIDKSPANSCLIPNPVFQAYGLRS